MSGARWGSGGRPTYREAVAVAGRLRTRKATLRQCLEWRVAVPGWECGRCANEQPPIPCGGCRWVGGFLKPGEGGALDPFDNGGPGGGDGQPLPVEVERVA